MSFVIKMNKLTKLQTIAIHCAELWIKDTILYTLKF